MSQGLKLVVRASMIACIRENGIMWILHGNRGVLVASGAGVLGLVSSEFDVVGIYRGKVFFGETSVNTEPDSQV